MAALKHRYSQVTIFVALWMALGWLLHLPAEAYLLLGIPLMIIFQLWLGRRPLRDLWVRDTEKLQLGAIGWIAMCLFIAFPLLLVLASAMERKWLQGTFFAASIVGAVGIGFSARHWRKSFTAEALRPFAIALISGLLVMAAGAMWSSHSPWVPMAKLPAILMGFITYLPICFVMEEVVFRGLLDTHACQPEGSRKQRWTSALLVSALWGLWHLPTLPDQSLTSLLAAAPVVILVHLIDGVFIAFSWRISGSLLLPAIYHSLIDAYRDVVNL